MFSSINTGTISGLKSYLIQVEVDTSPGLPCFQMVGYLGSEVREARERVRVALKNSGHNLPAKCININLSPASIRKSGTSFDLPIAIGLLTSIGEIDPDALKDTLVIGELGLDGEVRGVRGILPIVRMARSCGIPRVILPYENVKEGALIPDMEIIGVTSLSELCAYLTASDPEKELMIPPAAHINIQEHIEEDINCSGDFSDVHGQETVKRAAMIAAAGFHHLLMIGPPGSGKTMIAKRISAILPPLTADESLEVTSIYSVAGLLCEEKPLITARPYISPHHTITDHALAGGGQYPRPGAISLAHRGVLFLDELTEFNRSTLDIMRQPLEDKQVNIIRNTGVYTYPADFMLVAACNPCPCGYYPDRNKCSCTEAQVKKYISSVSGPLLDRIDICCNVDSVELCKPTKDKNNISSAELREKISVARLRQSERFKGTDIRFNSEMSARDIENYCILGADEQLLISSAYESLGLSARSYHRILKVARTIADTEDSDKITEAHLSEAILYRTNGMRYWGR
jgi:magnesium chelatase family protein